MKVFKLPTSGLDMSLPLSHQALSSLSSSLPLNCNSLKGLGTDPLSEKKLAGGGRAGGRALEWSGSFNFLELEDGAAAAAPKSPPPLFHGCCNRIFSGITPISQPEMRPGEEGLAAGSVIIGVRNAALIPCVICRKSETKFTTLVTKMSKSTYEGGASGGRQNSGLFMCRLSSDE